MDQYRNQFHITVSIFKGITLGAGAYALLAILAANGTLDARVQLTAIAFWTASFIATIVTYDGMMLQSIVTIAAPNVTDIMIPFFLGVSEFLLFPILAPVLSNGNPSRSTPAALRNLARVAARHGLCSAHHQPVSGQRPHGTDDDPGRGCPLSSSRSSQWEGILGPLFIGQLCFGLWSINQIRKELADTLAVPPRNRLPQPERHFGWVPAGPGFRPACRRCSFDTARSAAVGRGRDVPQWTQKRYSRPWWRPTSVGL